MVSKPGRIVVLALSGSLVVAALMGVTILTQPKAVAMPLDVTMVGGENLADRLGMQAGLALAEYCSLPVEMGTGRSTVALVRRHIEIDPGFTNNVAIKVIVQPGDHFTVDKAGKITCPTRN